nr:phosphoribosyltransferase family protein [Streptomyces cylindrosporus]
MTAGMQGGSSPRGCASSRRKGVLAHPVALALPRGGVSVVREVAEALEAPLDVLVVRKIGVPLQAGFGVGAPAGDDPLLFDEQALDRMGLRERALSDVVERERAEAHRREERYRHGRPAADVRGRTAIVVGDGVATGSIGRAALHHVRRQAPAHVVPAVPVCSPQAAELLRGEADEVVCLHRPDTFRAVGQWYEDFEQLTDEDVLKALHGTSAEASPR